MNMRIVFWLLPSVAVSGMSCLLSFFIIPTFARIFHDMVSPENLPGVTRVVLHAGPIGLTILAVATPALLVIADRFPRARRLYEIVIVIASTAVGSSIVALFLPMMGMLKSA